MSRKVLIFPGVGSHHVGMGKEFYRDFQVVRDTFEEASEVLKVDMAAMCFSVEKDLDELMSADCFEQT